MFAVRERSRLLRRYPTLTPLADEGDPIQGTTFAARTAFGQFENLSAIDAPTLEAAGTTHPIPGA
jgi:hypothetical protein